MVTFSCEVPPPRPAASWRPFGRTHAPLAVRTRRPPFSDLRAGVWGARVSSGSGAPPGNLTTDGSPDSGRPSARKPSPLCLASCKVTNMGSSEEKPLVSVRCCPRPIGTSAFRAEGGESSPAPRGAPQFMSGSTPPRQALQCGVHPPPPRGPAARVEVHPPPSITPFQALKTQFA